MSGFSDSGKFGILSMAAADVSHSPSLALYADIRRTPVRALEDLASRASMMCGFGSGRVATSLPDT